MNVLADRDIFDLATTQEPPPAAPQRVAPLAQILVDIHELSPGDMLRAVAMQKRSSARIGELLVAHGMTSEIGVYRALSIQHDCALVDLEKTPPDPRLIAQIGAETCLRLRIVPWRMIGASPILVTSEPSSFEASRSTLPSPFQSALMAVAPGGAIEAAIMGVAGSGLLDTAETRVPDILSGRNWQSRRFALAATLSAIAVVFMAVILPKMLITGLCVLALLALGATTFLKVCAMVASFLPERPKLAFRSQRGGHKDQKLPVVSLIIALRDEPIIVPALVRRLRRLTYPAELLDICLVTEQDDQKTALAIERSATPFGFRHVVVPPGRLATKPQALNYALSFCRGSIVGVLDAEDAPEADQILAVIHQFRRANDDVACLQGVLDFYNPRTGFLSRCFALEYAAWFRVFLPGLARLGLIVPLGGTTAYFRRDVLEDIGAWDAHNVTEDADLGVRLARKGYRTELVPTVTYEEANSQFWSWIKQRSRWLKGYAMTWAVHMRRPGKLLQELGLRRFLAFQVLFVGTLVHFLLAPALLSLWVLPFGLAHPLTEVLGPNSATALFFVFLCAEAIGFCMVALGLARAKRLRMLAWIPALHVYFWLATLSLYRAVFELAVKPHFWAKTAHGPIPHHRRIHTQRAKRSSLFFQRPVSIASRKPG